MPLMDDDDYRPEVPPFRLPGHVHEFVRPPLMDNAEADLTFLQSRYRRRVHQLERLYLVKAPQWFVECRPANLSMKEEVYKALAWMLRPPFDPDLPEKDGHWWSENETETREYHPAPRVGKPRVSSVCPPKRIGVWVGVVLNVYPSLNESPWNGVWSFLPEGVPPVTATPFGLLVLEQHSTPHATVIKSAKPKKAPGAIPRKKQVEPCPE